MVLAESLLDHVREMLAGEEMTPTKRKKRKVPTPEVEEIAVSTPTPSKRKRSKKTTVTTPQSDDEVVFEGATKQSKSANISNGPVSQSVVRKILEEEIVSTPPPSKKKRSKKTTETTPELDKDDIFESNASELNTRNISNNGDSQTVVRRILESESLVNEQLVEQQETTPSKRKKSKKLVLGQIYREFRSLGKKSDGDQVEATNHRQRLRNHNFIRVFVSNDTTKNPDVLTFWDSCVPQDPKLVSFKWSEDKKRLEGVHSTNKRVSYSGIEFKDPDFEYLIVLRDFNNNSVEGSSQESSGPFILEKVKIFRVRPVVNMVPQRGDVDLNAKKEDNRTKGEKMVEAMSKFGSKKANRILASRTKSMAMRVDANDVDEFQAVRDKNVDKAGQTGKEQNKAEEVVTSNLLPPRNVNAISVSEVYNFSDLVDEKLVNLLSTYVFSEGRLSIELDMIKKFLPPSFDEAMKPYEATSEVTEQKNSAREQTIKELEKDPVTKEKVLLAHYIDLLIRVYQLRAANLRKYDPFPQIQQKQVKDFLMKTFLEKTKEAGNGNKTYTKRFLSDKSKDRILITVLILILKLSNYAPIRVDEASKAFKISAVKIRSIGQLVGYHVEKKRSVESLVFKVPIYQIQSNKMRRKR